MLFPAEQLCPSQHGAGSPADGPPPAAPLPSRSVVASLVLGAGHGLCFSTEMIISVYFLQTHEVCLRWAKSGFALTYALI